eukprot:5558942-Prymnesium_polylepis.1
MPSGNMVMVMQYCVKWKGYHAKQSTCEPIEHLWKLKETPTLAKMVNNTPRSQDAGRQEPASSAGVERVFSHSRRRGRCTMTGPQVSQGE